MAGDFLAHHVTFGDFVAGNFWPETFWVDTHMLIGAPSLMVWTKQTFIEYIPVPLDPILQYILLQPEV